MTFYTISCPAIEHYMDAFSQFEHLLDRLSHEETQRMTHGEVESLIQSDGVELLRRLTQGYFDQRAAEEPNRERVVGEDGIHTDPSARRLRAASGDPLWGGDRHPPGLWWAGSGQCLPPGCGAEPAAGAQGLPIATGAIEGACRHLIKDRMDITGARWGLDRAEAILKLCSLKVSGDLEAYLAFHFKQERRRNHPGPPIPEVESEAA